MLEARSVAVVGASTRPASFGRRCVDEISKSAFRARDLLRKSQLFGDRWSTVRRFARRHSWAGRSRLAGNTRLCTRGGDGEGGKARRPLCGDLRQCLRARRRSSLERFRTFGSFVGRSQKMPEWLSAVRGAWALSTSHTVCGRSDTSSLIPYPLARSHWSVVRDRPSRRCSGRTGASGGRSLSPRVRSWSLRRLPTSTMRSDPIRPRWWPSSSRPSTSRTRWPPR